MKIYFAGSIKGGRNKVNDYSKIINHLSKYGNVLTTHVGDSNLKSDGEKINPKEIYLRDKKWLEECDILVAEVTLPSLGVGYEISYVESLNKKIIILYEKDKSISAMISGNDNLMQIPYTNIEELLVLIDKYFYKLK